MARGQDFSRSRKRSLPAETKWVLAMLGIGILAAVLLIVLVPDTEHSSASTGAAEQAAPSTARVRAE